VELFDESFAFPDSRERWLYTGVTRAAKRLTVVM
jgi:exodeoxyribonuclease-5